MSKFPIEKRPSTFPEFVQEIEEFQAQSEVAWYRGCGDSSFKLIPSLYRHPTKYTPIDCGELEDRLMTRFRQRSIPFHTRNFSSDWDLTFFMQHYGVPTRLLDWTENPFIALYFALMGARFNSKRKCVADVAFWMLEPIKWNRAALSHQSYAGGILYEQDKELKSYAPGLDFNSLHRFPVMIYGSHNSTRIVAQRGVFAIFGKELKSIEDVYGEDMFPSEALSKIIIGKDLVADFRRSLLAKGITESVVFPDLSGLSSEICREFGFGG